MTIADHKVVSFHYTLKNADGETLESSREREPMQYLHGANNIIPGLEAAMGGKSAGDQFEVTVEPEQAYGQWTEAAVQRVPLKHLQGDRKLEPGQVLVLQTQNGPMQVKVVKVGKFNADLDANHPLAGQTLTFDVEVTDVRDATEEEIEHGHAHGPGGHDHDHGDHDHD